jgi:hypothetical protein
MDYIQKSMIRSEYVKRIAENIKRIYLPKEQDIQNI